MRMWRGVNRVGGAGGGGSACCFHKWLSFKMAHHVRQTYMARPIAPVYIFDSDKG